MSAPRDAELTCDAFLGGRLRIRQPRVGYRAGIEPVLLAAATPARRGARVLELGCGVGVASLCLASRTGPLEQTAVEVQSRYADLARRNATEAGTPIAIVTADLAQLPADVRARSFDHVLANPPFHGPGGGPAAAEAGRAQGRGESTPLAVWLDVAVRRLAPKGVLTLIQAAHRLPEVLAGLDARVGGIEVLPLASRAGRRAKLVLLRAVKGSRTPFCLHAPYVLHAGEGHVRDADSYTAPITAVLRDGAAMPWPGGGRGRGAAEQS